MTHTDKTRPKPGLLLLAQAFPPHNISGAARPGRFAKYLARWGYPVYTVAKANGPAAIPGVRRVPDGRSRTRAAASASRLLRSVQRYALPYNDDLPWVPYAAAGALQEAASHPAIRVVFSTSPPISSHFAALWVKRRLGLPWIADFRDPLADNPFRNRRWPFPYDRMMERLFFANADAVVANTDRSAALWASRYPQWAHKLHVIWNGFDRDDCLGAPPLPEGGPRTILHAGTIYGKRHPAALLESVSRLIGRGARAAGTIRVRLVGPVDSPDFAMAQPCATRLRELGSLECIAQMVPQADARRAMAKADYLLLLDQNERDADLQIPAKVFDYIRVGRPVLCFTQPGSPSARVLELAGIPHVVVAPSAAAAEVDSAVLRLLSLGAEPTPASAAFEQQFDASAQTRALAAIVDSLCR